MYVPSSLTISYCCYIFLNSERIGELIDVIFYDSLSTLYSDYVINMILAVYAMRSGNDSKPED